LSRVIDVVPSIEGKNLVEEKMRKTALALVLIGVGFIGSAVAQNGPSGTGPEGTAQGSSVSDSGKNPPGSGSGYGIKGSSSTPSPSTDSNQKNLSPGSMKAGEKQEK
jgi:hypothetical protein